MQSGFVFDIKRYSINDGPGIRVTIFLKGCNLDCAWCHNPESKNHKVEKMYAANKCIGCSACVDNCEQNACTLTPEGIVTDKNLCITCGRCAKVCPTTATEMSGRMETTADLMKIIEKETLFFDQSGGGVTFSGGEPLLQPQFLFEMLDLCGRRGIHRAVDTAGLIKTETLLEAAKKTDLFLYDLKMMDSARHKKWTGVDNHKILENLKTLSAAGAEINIRIPLIAGVNDDDENIIDSAKFIAALEGEKKKVNILPYHNIAQQKYKKLGVEFNNDDMEEPDKDKLKNIIALFAEKGLSVKVGG